MKEEFILFYGRVIRKDLIKSVYIAYNAKDETAQPAIEFINDPNPLFIGAPTNDPKAALEIIYELYLRLGGQVDDVITCSEKMEEVFKDES